jgi:hypothetical protein
MAVKAILLAFNFRFLLKKRRLPSISNHKLSKNVYLENISLVAQQIIMSPAKLSVFIYVMIETSYSCTSRPGRFSSGIESCYPLSGGWGTPETGIYISEKKYLLPLPGMNLRSVQPVGQSVHKLRYITGRYAVFVTNIVPVKQTAHAETPSVEHICVA